MTSGAPSLSPTRGGLRPLPPALPHSEPLRSRFFPAKSQKERGSALPPPPHSPLFERTGEERAEPAGPHRALLLGRSSATAAPAAFALRRPSGAGGDRLAAPRTGTGYSA